MKARKKSEKGVLNSSKFLSTICNKNFDVNLLRNTQFLNPVKRKARGATSAISNLAFKITSVLEYVLGSIFQIESKHAVVDAIRNQCHFFQIEEIPEEWYVNQQAKRPTSSRHLESYWART